MTPEELIAQEEFWSEESKKIYRKKYDEFDGNEEKYKQWVLSEADKGNNAALMELWLIDRKKEYLMNAVVNEYIPALYEYGYSMFYGYNGYDQDIEKGLQYIKKAASAGFKMARYCLGTNYASGRIIPQDSHAAEYWLKQVTIFPLKLKEENVPVNYLDGLVLSAHFELAKMYDEDVKYDLAINQYLEIANIDTQTYLNEDNKEIVFEAIHNLVILYLARQRFDEAHHIMIKADAMGDEIAEVWIEELIKPRREAAMKEQSRSQGGCYVATAVYGSYDCPEVWTLRRFRDNVLAEHFLGRVFIKVYYAVSPMIVEKFGETKWFNRFWKTKLDMFVEKLKSAGFEDSPYKDC